MTHPPVDLRSDTVTQPTDAMREAIMAAPVGDDVMGEDPTVRALEERAADLLGFEASLFVPSGTMANLLAQLCLVPRGQEVIVGEASHCIRHEGGSGAALAGAQYRVVPGTGLLVLQDIVERYEPRSLHSAGTALVWLENTHNMAGGRPYDLDEIRAITAWCRERDLPVFMDGARLWNAAVATDVSPGQIARGVTALSTCVSKGLGAPVGSLLYGERTFITEARFWRKRIGGGMRQAGILAAAALYALEHHRADLADDHRRARRLAAGLAELPELDVDSECHSNIVVARRRPGCRPANELVHACKQQGVLFLPRDGESLRLVTHREIRDSDIDRAVDVVARELPRP